MAEVILPGTYITVRDEGLIVAGQVAAGNIGIVGTATDGVIGKVYPLSSFSEARQTFSPPSVTRTVAALLGSSTRAIGVEADENPGSRGGTSTARAVARAASRAEESGPADSTLLRALELIYKNGGRTVYAVRAQDSSEAEYKAALEKLENEPVNIVLLAGQDATQMGGLLRDHLTTTETIHRERIGIIGSDGSDDPATIIKTISDKALVSDRLIYVAPGIRVQETKVIDSNRRETTLNNLPGGYLSAAVAGLISSLPVQASPTNKTLNIDGLSTEFNTAKLESLVQGNVLAVEKRAGYRVVKGITTSDSSAWRQITTRRIVDYAIFGVRSACNPYIGKLNNERVRGAMKATLDAFLTRMVQDEALVGYTLEVSATRQEEIAGRAIVTMTLQPTFSIDFILVTMYLG